MKGNKVKQKKWSCDSKFHFYILHLNLRKPCIVKKTFKEKISVQKLYNTPNQNNSVTHSVVNALLHQSLSQPYKSRYN